MEYYNFSITENGLHIEGFPDAVKCALIDHPLARRASDLALHKMDLETAKGFLEAINDPFSNPRLIQTALWCSAIVHYFKCFGDSGARFQLSAKAIYKNEPVVALEVFDFFKGLRNKHYVHDENSYMQSIPSAVINGKEKPYKIEKIICLSTRAEVLSQENYSNLTLLINKAREWVVAEFDTCCTLLTVELEKLSHEELINLPNAAYKAPTIEDIPKNRRPKP